MVVGNKYWPTKKHTSLVSVPKSPFMKNAYRQAWHTRNTALCSRCRYMHSTSLLIMSDTCLYVINLSDISLDVTCNCSCKIYLIRVTQSKSISQCCFIVVSRVSTQIKSTIYCRLITVITPLNIFFMSLPSVFQI